MIQINCPICKKSETILIWNNKLRSIKINGQKINIKYYSVKIVI